MQVKRIARMVFGHNQHRFCLRAGTLDRVLGGVCGQLEEIGVEVVEAAREQVHVDRGHFVAGIADIDGAVKRRLVFRPLPAEPCFDFGLIG